MSSGKVRESKGQLENVRDFGEIFWKIAPMNFEKFSMPFGDF